MGDKPKMLVGEKGVTYGLQVRRAAPASRPAAPRPSVFGDDDSDGEAPNVERQIAAQAARNQSDAKVAALQAAALAEDPSVFDYDGHHDAIAAARDAPRRADKLARAPRYVGALLEKAEERRREEELLRERRLAKERAAEDHLYGDKERFVTAAYRAKLEAEAKWKADIEAAKAREEAEAVEKRGHMGDFYRNLLRNNVAYGGAPAAAAPAAAAAKPGAAAAAAAKPAAEEAARPAAAPPPARAEAGGSGASREAPPASAPPPAQRQQRQQPAAAEEGAPPAAAGGPAVPAPPPAAEAAPAAAAGQRRNKEEDVAAARERYLARKRLKTG